MSTTEDVLRNLAQLEDKINRLAAGPQPLLQAGVTAQMLQVHATLALSGAVLLVAEEIKALREQSA